MANYDLYVITQESVSLGRTHEEVAQAALAAGVKAVQLRDKKKNTRELLELARQLRELTREHNALLFVNDRVDVALAAGADGVHLGPEDLLVASARQLAGKRLLIGASVSTVAEALAAEAAGADYLSVGPIFRTATKPDAGEPVGVGRLQEIESRVRLPVIGIGGITRSNVAAVIAAGADGVAVISAVADAEDMQEAAATLLGLVRKARRQGLASTGKGN